MLFTALHPLESRLQRSALGAVVAEISQVFLDVREVKRGFQVLTNGEKSLSSKDHTGTFVLASNQNAVFQGSLEEDEYNFISHHSQVNSLK